MKGFMRDTCTASCNPGCIGACERETGGCSLCNVGYHGSRCQTECSSNCKPVTLNAIKVRKCEKDTGKCSNGCINRFHGDTCQNQLSSPM